MVRRRQRAATEIALRFPGYANLKVQRALGYANLKVWLRQRAAMLKAAL
jgi:hypothetical protein